MIGRATIHPVRKWKARVTIIVGIISSDGIVVASDSQTSYAPTSSNRRDTDKICKLKFASGGQVFVAQAGDAVMTGRAIEILQNEVSAASFDDYRKPAELAEKSVRTLKEEVANLNHWKPGDKSSVNFWEDTESAIMIAYFHQEKPYIYLLSFWPGVAIKQDRYACLGCGATVAEFILSRSYTSDIKLHESVVTAIYTVEEVKRVDSFCGGPTKIGILKKDGPSALTDNTEKSERLIKNTVQTISKYDSEIRAQWRKMMAKIISESQPE